METNTTKRYRLKLRLAARSLIEWNSSTQSPEYQHVLKLVLQHHPKRHLYHKIKNSKLLSLDKNGSILWHLSEALGRGTSIWIDTKLDDSDWKKLTEVVEEFVVTFALGEKADQWSSRLPDTIREALLSPREDLQIAGMRMFATLALPLYSDLQENEFLRLRAVITPSSLILRRVARISKILLTSGKYTNRLVLIVSTFFVVVSIFYTQGDTFTLPSIFDKFAKHFKYLDLWLQVPIIITSLLINFFLNKRSKGLINDLSVALLKLATKHSSTIDSLPKSQRTLLYTQAWKAAISELFASNQNVLTSMVYSDNFYHWAKFVFGSIETVPQSVAEEGLLLLNNIKIDRWKREEVFSWLCHVKIY